MLLDVQAQDIISAGNPERPREDGGRIGGGGGGTRNGRWERTPRTARHQERPGPRTPQSQTRGHPRFRLRARLAAILGDRLRRLLQRWRERQGQQGDNGDLRPAWPEEASGWAVVVWVVVVWAVGWPMAGFVGGGYHRYMRCALERKGRWVFRVVERGREVVGGEGMDRRRIGGG